MNRSSHQKNQRKYILMQKLFTEKEKSIMWWVRDQQINVTIIKVYAPNAMDSGCLNINRFKGRYSSPRNNNHGCQHSTFINGQIKQTENQQTAELINIFCRPNGPNWCLQNHPTAIANALFLINEWNFSGIYNMSGHRVSLRITINCHLSCIFSDRNVAQLGINNLRISAKYSNTET